MSAFSRWPTEAGTRRGLCQSSPSLGQAPGTATLPGPPPFFACPEIRFGHGSLGADPPPRRPGRGHMQVRRVVRHSSPLGQSLIPHRARPLTPPSPPSSTRLVRTLPLFQPTAVCSRPGARHGRPRLRPPRPRGAVPRLLGARPARRRLYVALPPEAGVLALLTACNASPAASRRRRPPPRRAGRVPAPGRGARRGLCRVVPGRRCVLSPPFSASPG